MRAAAAPPLSLGMLAEALVDEACRGASVGDGDVQACVVGRGAARGCCHALRGGGSVVIRCHAACCRAGGDSVYVRACAYVCVSCLTPGRPMPCGCKSGIGTVTSVLGAPPLHVRRVTEDDPQRRLGTGPPEASTTWDSSSSALW